MRETIAELEAFAHLLADASGPHILSHFRTQTEVAHKDGRWDFDPVTEADKGAERIMRTMIAGTYPDHGIEGEEYGFTPAKSGNGRWVLDPVDGTRAFIIGMPQWGTLIAFNDGKQPVLGMLDQPFLKERFVGADGHAYVQTPAGRTALHTRDCATLKDAVLSTTHPTAYFSPAEQDVFQRISGGARMTRYGGDCYAYALLAMGFIDVIIESALNAWDIQALIPIITNAGGIITNFEGGDVQHGGRCIACGDARLHAEILPMLAGVAA